MITWRAEIEIDGQHVTLVVLAPETDNPEILRSIEKAMREHELPFERVDAPQSDATSSHRNPR